MGSKENEELIRYAIALARPSFCEIQLSKFLITVKETCKTKEDVYKLFFRIRTGDKVK